MTNQKKPAMKITITINATSTLFEHDDGPQETGWILEQIASEFRRKPFLPKGPISKPVLDSQGYPIGELKIESEQAQEAAR